MHACCVSLHTTLRAQLSPNCCDCICVALHTPPLSARPSPGARRKCVAENKGVVAVCFLAGVVIRSKLRQCSLDGLRQGLSDGCLELVVLGYHRIIVVVEQFFSRGWWCIFACNTVSGGRVFESLWFRRPFRFDRPSFWPGGGGVAALVVFVLAIVGSVSSVHRCPFFVAAASGVATTGPAGSSSSICRCCFCVAAVAKRDNGTSVFIRELASFRFIRATRFVSIGCVRFFFLFVPVVVVATGGARAVPRRHTDFRAAGGALEQRRWPSQHGTLVPADCFSFRVFCFRFRAIPRCFSYC
mmetsp:Transcript_1690/g.3775  ORF Transcript_1690/g.3775 Transcript_1690/m.3775 type:complete len:299 (-) Transcript_1690:896-1792(-)